MAKKTLLSGCGRNAVPAEFNNIDWPRRQSPFIDRYKHEVRNLEVGSEERMRGMKKSVSTYNRENIAGRAITGKIVRLLQILSPKSLLLRTTHLRAKYKWQETKKIK